MPDIDPGRAAREEQRRVAKEAQRPALIAAALAAEAAALAAAAVVEPAPEPEPAPVDEVPADA